MAGLTLTRTDRMLPAPVRPRRSLAAEQLVAGAGQLAGGAGNLLFAIVAARLLAPEAFAELAAFLALYLLVHVFTGSVGAASALEPDVADGMQGRLWTVGIAASLVLVVLRGPVAALVGMTEPFVLALAVAAPVAALLPLERGRLYGQGDPARAAASHVAEPAVRLTLGVALVVIAGSGGAATAVALAGWVALLVAAPRHLGSIRNRLPERFLRDDVLAVRTGVGSAGVGASRTAVGAFVVFAILMNQDLLWANRLLPADEAVNFAVLSTLGGMAAFATRSVPLVLLGQVGRAGAFRTALGLAAGLGLVVVAVVWAASHAVIAIVFGGRYADAAPLAASYVLAMALFGIVRVIGAELVAGERRRVALFVLGAGALAQALATLAWARTAGAVATVTLVVMAALTAALAVVSVVDRVDVPRTALRTSARRMNLERLAMPWMAVRRKVVRRKVVQRMSLPRMAVPRVTVPRMSLTQVTVPGIPGPGRVAGAVVGLVPSPAGAIARLRQGADAVARRAAALSADRTVRVVAVMTLAGFAVRFTALRSIWLDEAIVVSQAKETFTEMIHRLRFEDVHPPLHTAVLWLSTRVIGSSELAVRFPSIVAGTLVVPMLYLTGRDLYGKRTGVVAAVLGAFAPFLVWYSQEARMYSFFALFATATLWGQMRAIRRGRPVDWIVYGVATAALLWTQYFAILHVAAQQFVFAWALWRRWRSGDGLRVFVAGWAATVVCVALALLPVVPILQDQLVAFGNRQAGGVETVPAQAGADAAGVSRSLSVYTIAANLTWALFGYHADTTMAQIVALWPLAMLALLFLLGRRRSAESTILLALVVGPMLALFGAGLIRENLFELRYFIGGVTMLLLLVARTVTATVRGELGRRFVVGVLVVAFGAGLADQQLNGANPRFFDFRGVLATAADRMGDDGVMLYAPDYVRPVVQYYAPDLPAHVVGRQADLSKGDPLVLVASFLDQKAVSGRVGGVLARLEDERELVEVIDNGRVKAWVFR